MSDVKPVDRMFDGIEIFGCLKFEYSETIDDGEGVKYHQHIVQLDGNVLKGWYLDVVETAGEDKRTYQILVPTWETPEEYDSPWSAFGGFMHILANKQVGTEFANRLNSQYPENNADKE